MKRSSALAAPLVVHSLIWALSFSLSLSLERGLFEPLRGPKSRENDPRTSVLRASSKPQVSKTVAKRRFASFFEAPGLETYLFQTSKVLEAMVEATVEDASKLCEAAGLEATWIEAT